MESIEERKNREEAEKKAKEEKRVATRLNKIETEIALASGEANRFVAEAFVKQKANSGASSSDRNLSRRVLREVKRYENTGRVSNWLASQFTKAQSLRETTAKKAQDQPESVPVTSISAPIPIPNADTDYEFEPIEIEKAEGNVIDFPFEIYSTTSGSGEPQIIVRSGIINSFVGTVRNIGTNSLTINDKTNFTVYLKADIDSNFTLEYGDNTPQSGNNIFYIDIGRVFYSELTNSYSIEQFQVGAMNVLFGEDDGQILFWDKSAAGWQLSVAPQENSILVWRDDNWSIIEAPSGEGTHVLGFTNSQIQWMETEDCSLE